MVDPSPATNETKSTADNECLPDCTASSILVTFFHLINDIAKLLPPNILDNFQFERLMASDVHDIKLFTDYEIDCLSKGNDLASLLSYTSTWSNHSTMKVLVNSFSEADQLLDEYVSKLYLSQSISSYPIPPFSSDMIPPDNSAHTILAIRYDQELYKCTLQCVFDVRSLMVEKFEIALHCLQLLAVRSYPTIFYWTIPKCVVNLIKTKMQEHSECLYQNDIIEVIIYLEPLLKSGNDAKIGSLAFTEDIEKSVRKYEVSIIYCICAVCHIFVDGSAG